MACAVKALAMSVEETMRDGLADDRDGREE